MYITFGVTSILSSIVVELEYITLAYRLSKKWIYSSGVEYMYYGFDGDESGVIGIHPYTAAYIF